MSSDLKYIYPISQVGSIEQLLRTTAHNAFFVVTPMTFEPTGIDLEVAKGSKNVNDSKDPMKKPQLYDRKSVRPVHRPTIIAKKRQQDAMKMQGFKPAATAVVGSVGSNEGNIDKNAPLIFNGIILRSQLVTLLKNKIFFHKDDLVNYYYYYYYYYFFFYYCYSYHYTVGLKITVSVIIILYYLILQSDSQPEISHLQLTADYPRYDSVFDFKLTDIEKNTLMVIISY